MYLLDMYISDPLVIIKLKFTHKKRQAKKSDKTPGY